MGGFVKVVGGIGIHIHHSHLNAYNQKIYLIKTLLEKEKNQWAKKNLVLEKQKYIIVDIHNSYFLIENFALENPVGIKL